MFVPILILFILCLSNIFLNLGPLMQTINFYGDTQTYMGWYGSLKQGIIPYLGHRTPVYPLLIALCEMFLDWNFILVLQSIYMAIAACIFFYIVRYFLESIVLSFMATLLIFSDYSLLQWNNLILTESMSLSTIIFWTYLQISYPQMKFKNSKAVMIFSDLFLVFLRPAYCLLPIFWSVTEAVLFRKNIKTGIIRSTVIVMALGSYMSLNYLQTERFQLSEIGPMSRLGNYLRINEPSHELCEKIACTDATKKLVQILDVTRYDNDPWAVIKRLQLAFPERDMSSLLDDLYRDFKSVSFLKYAKHSASKASILLKEHWIYYGDGYLHKKFQFLTTYSDKWKTTIADYGNMILIFMFLCALGIYLLSFKIKLPEDLVRSRVIIFTVIIYLCCINLTGTYGEWFRLIVPIRPFVMLLVLAVPFEMLRIRKLFKQTVCG